MMADAARARGYNAQVFHLEALYIAFHSQLMN